MALGNCSEAATSDSEISELEDVRGFLAGLPNTAQPVILFSTSRPPQASEEETCRMTPRSCWRTTESGRHEWSAMTLASFVA